MRNTNKKGFTIVELVIVVAVIAILAAVLIPTFSGIINKANQSADEVAVRNMNTILATATKTPANIMEAAAVLAENGFNTEKGLTPMHKNHAFYWFKPTNQVVYVDVADGKFDLLFPADVKGFNKDDCQSLEYAIAGTVNAPSVSNNSTTVGSNLNANVTVPNDLTTFESVATWLNNLSGHQSITCTVNGVTGKTGVAISDNIKLSEDVVIDIHNGASTLVLHIVGDVTIDLNGHSITQYGQTGQSLPLFVVGAGSTLNIIDSSANKAGGIYASYTAVQVSTGGTLNLYSGTIGVTPEEHRRADDGIESLFVYGGTFNMYGGKVDATEESWAIGNSYAAMSSTSAVNLYGGEIIGWADLTNIATYNNCGVSITGIYPEN